MLWSRNLLLGLFSCLSFMLKVIYSFVFHHNYTETREKKNLDKEQEQEFGQRAKGRIQTCFTPFSFGRFQRIICGSRWKKTGVITRLIFMSWCNLVHVQVKVWIQQIETWLDEGTAGTWQRCHPTLHLQLFIWCRNLSFLCFCPFFLLQFLYSIITRSDVISQTTGTTPLIPVGLSESLLCMTSHANTNIFNGMALIVLKEAGGEAWLFLSWCQLTNTREITDHCLNSLPALFPPQHGDCS